MAYQSVNPYNGETLKTFEQLTDKQLEEKLAVAATCFNISGSGSPTLTPPIAYPSNPISTSPRALFSRRSA